jgi:hypothetical protein
MATATATRPAPKAGKQQQVRSLRENGPPKGKVDITALAQSIAGNTKLDPKDFGPTPDGSIPLGLRRTAEGDAAAKAAEAKAPPKAVPAATVVTEDKWNDGLKFLTGQGVGPTLGKLEQKQLQACFKGGNAKGFTLDAAVKALTATLGWQKPGTSKVPAPAQPAPAPAPQQPATAPSAPAQAPTAKAGAAKPANAPKPEKAPKAAKAAGKRSKYLLEKAEQPSGAFTAHFIDTALDLMHRKNGVTSKEAQEKLGCNAKRFSRFLRTVPKPLCGITVVDTREGTDIRYSVKPKK